MKKIFLLLSVVGLFSLSSCNNDDDVYVDTDTIAEVFEINANFGLDSGSGFYKSYYELNPPIYTSDMILVYKLYGQFQGNDIWELIPRTINYDNGDSVTYDYNFTYQDIELYMDANLDLGLAPEYTQNQIFRVVIIPAFDSSASARMNFNDYETVVKQFNIDESNIKTLTKKK